MGPDLIVVAPPQLDAHLGIGAIAEPLQREVLVAERPVEGFIDAVLPGLTRVDERGLDLGRLEPAKNRPRDKLGPIVPSRKEVMTGQVLL